MLVAHLVPGYFAAVWSQPMWKPTWTARQRAGLWVVALCGTVAPDTDVMYNALFRGFFSHSLLWTHSIFVHAGIALCWWGLHRIGRWHYLSMLVGLVAIGGLSHLLLDVIAHSTPLFYPLSVHMVGAPSDRVIQGKLWGYLTDPIVLLEPVFVGIALARWVAAHPEASVRKKAWALFGLLGGVAVIVIAFLLLLPTLQSMAKIYISAATV